MSPTTTSTIDISSVAFAQGQPIPAEYTCDGKNVSPPLRWANVPAAAKALALICDDPDAPRGTYVHWVLFDLQPAVRELPAGVPTTERLQNGARQGKHSGGRVGYTGPCPPSGTHRYFFKLYALDRALELKGTPTKDELLAAMEGHVIGRGELMGTYSRQR